MQKNQILTSVYARHADAVLVKTTAAVDKNAIVAASTIPRTERGSVERTHVIRSS